ncbi:MAG: hypothetical protein PVF73_09395 [Bacteroidales bacterium]|jgi:hypothetical protein
MLKVITWNLEHSDRMITQNPSAAVINRRQRILSTLRDIDPDIICLTEGPKGEKKILDFCAQVLQNEWHPVLLDPAGNPGDRDSEYGTRGAQWIWFLVKPGILQNCSLQSPVAWKDYLGYSRWPVYYWGKTVTSQHYHYRHPQVMIYRIDNNHNMEFIGVHLKSKINMKRRTYDANGNLTGEYLDEALKARAKLTTEARNIRRYIDVKFNQVAAPAIVLLGDCNDGPGLDFFEERYMYFDLITNLQGEVIVAEKYFNHSLFDYDPQLRWSASYRVLAPDGSGTAIQPFLLDNIIFSQALVKGNFPMKVNPRAGRIEHEAYERHNVGSNNNTKTSDHRPASCIISDNP